MAHSDAAMLTWLENHWSQRPMRLMRRGGRAVWSVGANDFGTLREAVSHAMGPVESAPPDSPESVTGECPWCMRLGYYVDVWERCVPLRDYTKCEYFKKYLAAVKDK